jgi:hypothetical protein
MLRVPAPKRTAILRGKAACTRRGRSGKCSPCPASYVLLPGYARQKLERQCLMRRTPVDYLVGALHLNDGRRFMMLFARWIRRSARRRRLFWQNRFLHFSQSSWQRQPRAGLDNCAHSCPLEPRCLAGKQQVIDAVPTYDCSTVWIGMDQTIERAGRSANRSTSVSLRPLEPCSNRTLRKAAAYSRFSTISSTSLPETSSTTWLTRRWVSHLVAANSLSFTTSEAHVSSTENTRNGSSARRIRRTARSSSSSARRASTSNPVSEKEAPGLARTRCAPPPRCRAQPARR